MMPEKKKANMYSDSVKQWRENKPFFIGIILGIIGISGIIIGFEIYKPEPEYTYFAIDDIGISSDGNDPFSDNTKITYNSTKVSIGGGESGGNFAVGFIMRFDLKNKPKSWTNCLISLYQFSVYGGVASPVYLFEGNWTEEEWDGYGTYMREIEIYWRFEESIGNLGSQKIGFKFLNITEYINNITTTTFSIAVKGRLYGGWGNSFYSSEWDNTNYILPFPLYEGRTYKDYLPQLIWS